MQVAKFLSTYAQSEAGQSSFPEAAEVALVLDALTMGLDGSTGWAAGYGDWDTNEAAGDRDSVDKWRDWAENPFLHGGTAAMEGAF